MELKYPVAFARWPDDKKSRFLAEHAVDLSDVRLLPVRWRPFPDELLTSWLLRLSRANSVGGRLFASILGVSDLRMFASIDALDIPNFLDRLRLLTGVASHRLSAATFYDFRWSIPGLVLEDGNLLYGRMALDCYRPPRGLRLLNTYRVCLECWKSDAEPYIRRSWRAKFITVCDIHKIALSPKCKTCGNLFTSSLHRLAAGNYGSGHLAICRYCGSDIRIQQPYAIDDYEDPNPAYTELLREDLRSRPAPDMGVFVQIEAIYFRAFERGWFTLSDSKKLNGKRPYRAPWAMTTLSGCDYYAGITTMYLTKEFPDFYEERVARWMRLQLQGES